jgi:hypothetical protein
MAHFAKIDDNNLVLQVLTVDNENATTESNGQTYLETHNNWPANKWIQTSYNTWGGQHKLGGTPFRGNFAVIGYTWDASNEIFWAPKPYASWTKNNSTASWVSPLGAEPSLTAEQTQQNLDGTHGWKYNWDEDAYQADNSTGWTLVNGLA